MCTLCVIHNAEVATFDATVVRSHSTVDLISLSAFSQRSLVIGKHAGEIALEL